MEINSIILSEDGLQAFDNGAWVSDIPGGGDVRLKVCAISAPETQKALTAKQEAMRTANGGKALSAEQSTKALNEVLAEVVLKDWDGITSDGAPVPFDRALAIKWVSTRHGEKFANMVFRASQMVDNNANAFVEAAEKNSSPA